MLLLAEPPRCNVATKSGYPCRGERAEPCYGESKCRFTLPNINPCDGSIDSIASRACGHEFVCVREQERERESEEESRTCAGHLIFTETHIALIRCSRPMHVLRYVAIGCFSM